MMSLFFQKPKALCTAVFVIGAVMSTGVFASGSYGGGVDESTQTYNLGKGLFYKKLACKSCPFPGTDIDEAQAKELVVKLIDQPDLSKLNEAERSAVVAYLTKRYQLK